jgi:hypothetical protein
VRGPYCATGHFHSYPANVVLWGSKAAGPGRQRYTRITELYPGVHPPYVRSAGYLLGDAVPLTTGPAGTSTVSYSTVTRRSALN